MAHRHLMAVCVVCLLCAEHMPCSHAEHVLAPSKNANSIVKSLQILSPSDDAGRLTKAADIAGSYLYDKRKDKTKVAEDLSYSRQKRHAGHDHNHEKHHHEETPEVTKVYIKKLFSRFSNRDTNTMNVEEFEKMMLQLDLKNLVADNVDPHKESNSTCMNGLEFLGKMTEQKDKNSTEVHTHDDQSSHGHHQHSDNEDSHHHPSTFRERLKIEPEHMLSICPILLYHVINRLSPLEGDGCLNGSYFSAAELYLEKEQMEMEPRSIVWLYSTLSIIGVSLCGLLGVAVIPIMEKHFYHHVLQFLVALAVGTLAGDALLHLLPHAMMPLSDDHEDLHQTMMLRGLAAVGGIVMFYFFERFITMITEWRQQKQKRDKPSSRVRVMRDPESVSLNNGAAMTCKHKYSSYPYCYDEIAMETKDDHHEHQHIEEEVLNNQLVKLKGLNDDHIKIVAPAEIKKLNGAVDHNNDTDNNTLSTSVDEGSVENKELCNNNKHSEKAVVIPMKKDSMKKDSLKDENYTIILREHQSKHHGHSHTHGHVHSPPGSLSAVVWMVIMGDGLHNFTDGMAIGAAFSNNIAGGLSTAVAVFCHELPHELGDFAVLLKAGMSAKEAVYYNILSSVLSFFGMCVGIWLGDTPEASQWIFAVAAGLFIYIALVDMMPELTSSHGKEEGFMLTQILLQFVGMCCGFSIMLLIAIYEHDLKEMFAS